MYVRKTFACLALMLAGTAQAGDFAHDSQLLLKFATAFGGTSHSGYTVQFGSTATLPTEVRAFYGGAMLPVSGISYSSATGLSPMFMGLALRSQASDLNAAEESGGISWGWIAAGVAVAAGAAAALSGSGGGSNDDEGQQQCDETELAGTDGGDGDDPFIVGCSAN